MDYTEKILSFIDKFSYLWSDYIVNQLKEQFILDFIRKIIITTKKSPSEAVLIFFSAIRYITQNTNAIYELENNKSFQEFIKQNKDKILKIIKEKNVQANLPERAFPVIDIINKKFKNKKILVIELGASFGLIGRCLLNSHNIITNKNSYFNDKQKYPEEILSIDKYIGIEIKPPEKEWLLACVSGIDDEKNLENFINNINNDEKFILIKASAFGFTDIINNYDISEYQTIILTSFMLYQFDLEKQKILIDEILNFNKKNNAHWINQAVNIKHNSSDYEYYIEWNGSKIIELIDDRCTDWKWI